MPTGFFALAEEEMIRQLIAHIVEQGACPELFEEARRVGRTEHLLELLVRLAGIKDIGMMQQASDTLTLIEPGQETRSMQVNERIDDSGFKESLLYEIRDNVPPESPLLDPLFEAYRAEPDRMTRMRIVRAIGKIGGAKARQLLRRVAEEEHGRDTPAMTEARRHLGDPSA